MSSNKDNGTQTSPTKPTPEPMPTTSKPPEREPSPPETVSIKESKNDA